MLVAEHMAGCSDTRALADLLESSPERAAHKLTLPQPLWALLGGALDVARSVRVDVLDVPGADGMDALGP